MKRYLPVVILGMVLFLSVQQPTTASETVDSNKQEVVVEITDKKNQTKNTLQQLPQTNDRSSILLEFLGIIFLFLFFYYWVKRRSVLWIKE